MVPVILIEFCDLVMVLLVDEGVRRVAILVVKWSCGSMIEGIEQRVTASVGLANVAQLRVRMAIADLHL